MMTQVLQPAIFGTFKWHTKNVGYVSPVTDVRRGNQEEWDKRIKTVLIGYLNAFRRGLVVSNKLSIE